MSPEPKEAYAKILSQHVDNSMFEEERAEDIKRQLKYMGQMLGSFGRFGEKSNFKHIYLIVEEWKEFFER